MSEPLKGINIFGQETTTDITAVFNMIYPVGSIYWSSKPTDPANLFGGTWTQIKDRFVLAAGDTYTTVPVGNATSGDGVGGSATVQLTEPNLPKHNHGGSTGNTNTDHWHATWDMSGDNYARWQGFRRGQTGYTNGRASFEDYNAGQLDGWDGEDNAFGVGLFLNMSHTHNTKSVSETYSDNNQNHSHTIDYSGENTPHDNMPPYIVKYCWERIA